MTDEELEAIRKRAEAATPGPWWTSAKYNEEECGVCVIAANENCGPLPGNPTRGQVAWATELLPYRATQCENNATFIAHARTDIPLLISALDAAIERAEKAEALVYVPGFWKCAKCNFVLQQSNLNAHDGTVTPRDEPGDRCPNCASPLWRVSWKEEAADRLATVGRFFDDLTSLRARVAEYETERDTLREAGRYMLRIVDVIRKETKRRSDERYSLRVPETAAILSEDDARAALKGASHEQG